MTNDDKEEVIFAIHQHPWFFAKFISLVFFFTIIILISIYFLGASQITSYLIFFSIALCGFVFFYDYYRWSNTQYLLTNHRLISHEQKKLFHKEMKEALLVNILFISHENKGLINNIINRGSVHIRSSGVIENEIVLNNISNPFDIEQKIIEMQKQYAESIIEEKTENIENKKERTIIR